LSNQEGCSVFDLAEAGFVAGVSMIAALSALLLPVRRAAPAPQFNGSPDDPVALLFDDGFLHHATAPAQSQFSLTPGVHIWADLRKQLLDQFPDLPLDPGTGDQGHVTLRARSGPDPQQMDLKWQGPLSWVTLSDPHQSGANTSAEIPQNEVSALRLNSETSPHPAWQMDREGHTIWANTAYAALADRIGPGSGGKVFDLPDQPGPHRTTVTFQPESRRDHYSIVSKQVGEITVCHATRINALVNAENARLNFVQTLTKTFAHLPTGLAIFDRNEQLALFNPALVDLSGLSGAYLSGQPTMLSFFDQLRENRRMPEPKNYANWRDEIGSLIRAASDDGYHETWTLEDGRTFNVQGRPHPDGATAFLIDDITASIMITRNFRKELEMGQNLLDTIDDAIAVFSRSGVLTLCNAVYRDLWDQNPETSFADVTIHDAIRVWGAVADQQADWSGIEDFVTSFEDPEPLELNTISVAGRRFDCQLRAIAPGARMVRFKARSPVQSARKTARKKRIDPV
jgi:PAS domain-containing protein